MAGETHDTSVQTADFRRGNARAGAGTAAYRFRERGQRRRRCAKCCGEVVDICAVGMGVEEEDRCAVGGCDYRVALGVLRRRCSCGDLLEAICSCMSVPGHLPDVVRVRDRAGRYSCLSVEAAREVDEELGRAAQGLSPSRIE